MPFVLDMHGFFNIHGNHEVFKSRFWLDKDDLSDPEFRLDELMHLAELCIEVTQQNDEYHSEVRIENSQKNYGKTT